MSYAEALKTVTLEAQADHTGDQHKFVVAAGVRGFALAGAGDKALGVLLNKPSNAKTADHSTNSHYGDGVGGTIALISAGGVAPVVTGGAIEAGASVAVGAGGLAVTASGDSVGIAQEAAGGEGEVISVLLTYDTDTSEPGEG